MVKKIKLTVIKMKTLITAIIISLIATEASAETVSQKFIETEFSDNSTEAQRDFAWKDIENKHTISQELYMM